MIPVGTVRLTLDVNCADVSYSITREYQTTPSRVYGDVEAMLTKGSLVILEKVEELPNAKI